MNLADQHRKNRSDLGAARTTEAGKLASLKVERAAIDGRRKAVEADLGPVRYSRRWQACQPQGGEGGHRRTAQGRRGRSRPSALLATLLSSTDEQTMRWFILVVAMLLDPAAVLLLLVSAEGPTFVARHRTGAQQANKQRNQVII
jgi:hypothetical protein